MNNPEIHQSVYEVQVDDRFTGRTIREPQPIRMQYNCSVVCLVKNFDSSFVFGLFFFVGNHRRNVIKIVHICCHYY